MAASGVEDKATIVDSFVPPKDSFDHDLAEELKEEDVQRKWELERDLAQQGVYQGQLTSQDYERAAMAQISLSRKRVKDSPSSVVGLMCAWLVEHQIGISVNLVLLLAMTHAMFPRLRPSTRKFFALSYYDRTTERYGTGWDDMYFVALWTVIVTGLRVAVMQYMLEPLARFSGITRKRVRVRYAEQGWLALYYFASWMLGMYIMYQRPYFFNLRELWTNFPTASIDGVMKWYYLVQFGFWIQQIIVVNIEERRKDYAQMFTHHIFTCALIFFSYGFHQTKVGNVILCIMDVVDILLSVAKCLKYSGYQTACDLMFVAFMVSWLIARHGFYLMVCWSIWVDVPQVMHYGCYDAPTGKKLTGDYTEYSFGSGILTNLMRGWQQPDGVVCFNSDIRMTFLYLLLGLQVITVIWFTMILRVAYRVLTGKGADEVRSEDEGGPDTEDDEVPPLKPSPGSRKTTPPTLGAKRPTGSLGRPYLTEDVTADQLYLPRRTSSPKLGRRTSKGGRTSAIHIPGHSDPKDILNRIGCETKTTDKD